jgi:bacterioferritin-associated ferredoxin
MYICVCNGINERDIRSAVDAGARTLGDLQRELGVASGCGQCAAEAQCLLRESRRDCAFSAQLQPA